RSSAPAFSVKVMAAISERSAAPLSTRATTRVTRALVLPDPAPASTKRVASRSSRIRSRSDWSGAGGRAGSATVGLPEGLLLGRHALERLGEVGVGGERRVGALAVPGPAEVGDAEAVGVAHRALDVGVRGGGVARVGGEDAGLDPGHDGAEHRPDLGQLLVGQRVADPFELAGLGDEPVLGRDGGVGVGVVEAAGDAVDGELQPPAPGGGVVLGDVGVLLPLAGLVVDDVDAAV